jgi:hypothetical protein
MERGKMSTRKELRTKGAFSQLDYDSLVADLDISSLRFLAQKYAKDLHYFRSHNDLNDQDNAQSYKEMQQRKKMIEDELEFRENLADENNTDTYFTDGYDIINVNDKGKKIIRPSLNEDGSIDIIEPEDEYNDE